MYYRVQILLVSLQLMLIWNEYLPLSKKFILKSSLSLKDQQNQIMRTTPHIWIVGQMPDGHPKPDSEAEMNHSLEGNARQTRGQLSGIILTGARYGFLLQRYFHFKHRTGSAAAQTTQEAVSDLAGCPTKSAES